MPVFVVWYRGLGRLFTEGETFIDSFTVSLQSPNGRHLPAVRALQGDCPWPSKSGDNLAKRHCNWGIPQPIFRPATQKSDVSQLEVIYVSYPTDSPTTIGLGLCNSLEVLQLPAIIVPFGPIKGHWRSSMLHPSCGLETIIRKLISSSSWLSEV